MSRDFLRSPLVGLLACLLALVVAMGVGRFSLTPQLPHLIREGQLDLTGAGLLAAANYLGYLVGALDALFAREARQARLRLLVGLWACFGLTLASVWAEGFWPHALLRFGLGVASAWVLIMVTALSQRLAAESGRARLGALVFAGPGIGVMVTGLLAALGNALGQDSVFIWKHGSVYSDLRGLLKNTTGYDLKQLFVGAEGTLGIVTRAVLRLEPLQRPGATALLGLPDVDAAITIAARLRREHAERLFACEILWHDYLQCTAAPMGDSAPSLAPCPLYLLVELAEDRHLDAGEALTALLEDCFEDGLVEDALLAANETQRLAIWRLREDSDAAIHAGVDSLSFDVSLPVPALAGYVERIRRRLDDLVKGMQVFLFGHFLDGNLHVMLAADVPLLPLHQAVEEILYGELGECAGVISAEHGIGLEKKEALGRYADPLKLALMAQIKELLDPSGLFNPGKVIP